MDTKKYISLDKLKTFLSNLKGVFAPLIHKHTLNDISDLLATPTEVKEYLGI